MYCGIIDALRDAEAQWDAFVLRAAEDVRGERSQGKEQIENKKITPTGYQPIRVNQERFVSNVNRVGLEPTTRGLKGRCSTN